MKKRLLLALVLFVSLAGLLVELVHSQSHAPLVELLVGAFSLSHEGNLPTWFASSLCLCCGLLLASVSIQSFHKKEPHRWRWALLSAGFFYISLDETVEMHERLGGWLGTGGVLYFDWVIPAGALVLVLLALYIPFLRGLPPTRRMQFILAGVLFVGGAVLMELPLGWWTEQHGSENLTYAMIDWVEETLELCGVSYFLYSLWEPQQKE